MLGLFMTPNTTIRVPNPLFPRIASISSHQILSRTPSINPAFFTPKRIRRQYVVVCVAENRNGKGNGGQKQGDDNGDGGGGGEGSMKRETSQRLTFNLRWVELLLDPNPDNVLAVGLTGLLTWASVQVLWQLLVVALAIVVAAFKYSLIAALLLSILITLL